MNELLLAKSSIDGRPAKTLVDHTKDVMAAVGFLYGTEDRPTRLAREWLRFFRLENEDYGRFLANTLAAAAFHDPGKANDGFQKVVTQAGQQSIRHEHLSGLLLSLPEFQAWIQHNPLLDFDIVLASVISHHLKVDPAQWGKQQLADAKTFRVFSDTQDFTILLNTIGAALHLPLPFHPNIPCLWSFQSEPNAFCFSDLLEEAKFRAHRFGRELKNTPQRFSLLLAVKAALLAADSAGSGVVRVGQNLETWINAAFSNLLTAKDVYKKVIIPRVREVRKKARRKFLFQDFQKQAAKLGERALMLAPCGSGKTLAAWCWIAARLRKKSAARVLFLYPTRATATEGFRDYVSWAPEEDAALAHGTAAYDLEEMFENPADSRAEKDFTAEDRLYALGLWPKRLFSATADQFLAFMQNQYGPLCLLPLIVDSVVIVDEVHSFDKQMFSALVKFLKRFDVPVLCMTASLTASRRRTLVEECGLQIFPNTLQGLDDLRVQAEHPRYCLRRTTQKEAEQLAEQAFAERKKVLWVVNQVRRCQDIAISMSRKIGEDKVLCYHSRFKLEHRRDRHKAVVNAFQTAPGPLLAVTTQVCEMSLDLDADMLITEEAPIPSLIQRMGRCNRQGKPGDGKVGEVFIYSVQDSKPYLSEELATARKFIEALDGKSLSQADLEAAMEQHQTVQREPERFSSFLESGCYAMSYPYREGEDFTTQAVLDSEIEAWRAVKAARKPTDGFLIPVPKRFARPHTALGRFLGAAPANHYHENFGFLEETLKPEN